MLDIIKTIEISIINMLSLYILVSNVLFIIRSRRCPNHNWELGVPGMLVGILVLTFHCMGACLSTNLAVQDAIRRGIIMVMVAVFAGQVKVRDRCLG